MRVCVPALMAAGSRDTLVVSVSHQYNTNTHCVLHTLSKLTCRCADLRLFCVWQPSKTNPNSTVVMDHFVAFVQGATAELEIGPFL